MAISKRDQMMLVVLVVFLVTVFVWLRQTPPHNTGLTGPVLPLEEAESKRAVALKTIKQMSDDQDTINPRIASNAYDMSAEELQPRIVQDLQRLATRAGFHIRQIKSLHPHVLSSGQAVRVPLEVRFRADFQPNIVKFLYFVEDPAGKMVVDKVNLTGSDSKFKTVDVSAQISVFTRSLNGVTNTDTGGLTGAN